MIHSVPSMTRTHSVKIVLPSPLILTVEAPSTLNALLLVKEMEKFKEFALNVRQELNFQMVIVLTHAILEQLMLTMVSAIAL
jgi:hypothetical protein